MDSLSTMIDRLKPNDMDFKERLLNVTSVYSEVFDSDTVLRFLKEDTLFTSELSDWLVKIPPMLSIKGGNLIKPKTVELYPNITVPMPDTIEEFRSMCKANRLPVSLNTQTAIKLFK